MLHVMSAAGKTLGALGFKAYVTNRRGTHFHFHLFDGRTGEHQAWIQADYLGQVRTGAASGVAAKYLARPDSARVGLFGSGKQARTQLLAVSQVCPVERVTVYSPNEERRTRFAKEMSATCRIEVLPAPKPEEAALNQDIIITATASREAVLFGDWIAEGTHLNIVGSNFLSKSEIDTQTVRRANRIVVDSKDQAHVEAGDLLPALEEGVLDWASVHELGQIIAGRFTGRQDAKEITLFKSVGLAIEDLAVAVRVFALAKQRGVGKVLDV